ncbi:helix-turn-helix domain-containing protein [Sphingomonas paucimobilis]|jgi:hypothetical protein|uniref:helix-turn-helix domain-containing protein n=1 Tax=Sphingomonas paucimobilis TaxID=13689 RepID=UPI0036F3F55D
MLEARRALLYTNLSVAEFGYAIGLADPANFSRFFIRQEGWPPQAFRARKPQEADISAPRDNRTSGPASNELAWLPPASRIERFTPRQPTAPFASG